MTEQRQRLIDTFGGRLLLALTIAVGVTIIAFAAVDPAELPPNCRMVGKFRKCDQPSPTPSETWWRIGGPCDHDGIGRACGGNDYSHDRSEPW